MSVGSLFGRGSHDAVRIIRKYNKGEKKSVKGDLLSRPPLRAAEANTSGNSGMSRVEHISELSVLSAEMGFLFPPNLYPPLVEGSFQKH